MDLDGLQKGSLYGLDVIVNSEHWSRLQPVQIDFNCSYYFAVMIIIPLIDNYEFLANQIHVISVPQTV